MSVVQPQHAPFWTDASESWREPSAWRVVAGCGDT